MDLPARAATEVAHLLRECDRQRKCFSFPGHPLTLAAEECAVLPKFVDMPAMGGGSNKLMEDA